MKRLYLHIGFNKTGSTSLQQCLCQNRATLEASGYLYPGAAQDSYVQNQQHTPLAASLTGRDILWLTPRKRDTLDRALPDLLTAIEASPAEAVILSSEAFGGLDVTEAQLQQMAGKLAGFDLRILAYIRRQDSYFLSTYQEDIKNGGQHLFQFKRYAANRQLAFGQRLAPWRAVFGAERVIVRPFDHRFWPEGRLEYDFLDAIGAPRDDIRPLEKPANESLDVQTLEFLRRLNQLGKADAAYRLSGPDIRRLTAAFSQQLDAGAGRHKLSLSTKQSETLRAHFRDDNLVALAGSGIEVDAFFPPAPPDQTTRIAPSHLDIQTLLKLVAAQQTALSG